MDCDFQAGDEVVCVDDGTVNAPGFSENGRSVPLVKGIVYTVEAVKILTSRLGRYTGIHVVLTAPETKHWRWFDGVEAGYGPRRFRKVQRRDLTEWLSQSVGNTDKLDKKKVRTNDHA